MSLPHSFPLLTPAATLVGFHTHKMSKGPGNWARAQNDIISHLQEKSHVALALSDSHITPQPGRHRAAAARVSCVPHHQLSARQTLTP